MSKKYKSFKHKMQSQRYHEYNLLADSIERGKITAHRSAAIRDQQMQIKLALIREHNPQASVQGTQAKQ